jgi:hypothetical protein
MRYSTDTIYYYSGQFDTVVSVTLGYGTKSRELYSDFLLGEFYYTKAERTELEKRVSQSPVPSTDGYGLSSLIAGKTLFISVLL